MTIDFPRETEIETKNEMDAVLQAGRVLMESGAEIYRIETPWDTWPSLLVSETSPLMWSIEES